MSSKYKRFVRLFNDKITSDYLVETVTSRIGLILDLRFDKHEAVCNAITIGDLLNVNGFYTSPWVVNYLVEILVGRTMNILAAQCRVDLESDEFYNAMLGICRKTQPIEKAAVPMIIEKCIQKFGTPIGVDEEALRQLQDKVDSFQQLLDAYDKGNNHV